ncbi:hypothetical protein [Peptostreptococcus faecalis]|uniref:hypothetical protein n=1 Tax=Peptostreptococcus faecalis TaxID=2045015 RepID=UPI000C79C306|nr:hypothetical protein [Peptostreptococcus faecalis]
MNIMSDERITESKNGISNAYEMLDFMIKNHTLLDNNDMKREVFFHTICEMLEKATEGIRNCLHDPNGTDIDVEVINDLARRTGAEFSEVYSVISNLGVNKTIN